MKTMTSWIRIIKTLFIPEGQLGGRIAAHTCKSKKKNNRIKNMKKKKKGKENMYKNTQGGWGKAADCVHWQACCQ